MTSFRTNKGIAFLQNYEQSLIILALVLTNFVIKGLFLAGNSLGGDEPFSVYVAQMDATSILKYLSEGNNPPLYELLLHFWIKIFGISEFAVRFPSLLFSCVTVWFIYKIGVTYLNKRIALYAGILFIFSNYHILFAHEARVYALLGMLTVISMYIFMGILRDSAHGDKDENISSKSIATKFLLLALVNTVIIYSHYFGFFVLIVQVIYLIMHYSVLLKYWKQVLLYAGILVVLYLPNIIIVFNRFVASSEGTWLSPPNGIASIYNMLWAFSNAPVVTVCVLLVIVGALVRYFTVFRKDHKNPNNPFIVFWFAFIFFFMFGISFSIPMFLDRYLMPAAIAFIFLIAMSADYVIKRPRWRILVPALICILFIASHKPNLTNKRNVKEAVETVSRLRDSETLVIVCPSSATLEFAYYYNRNYFREYNTTDLYANAVRHLSKENIAVIDNINEVNLENRSKVIYLDAAADFSSPGNNIKAVLDKKFTLTNTYRVYEIYNIYKYR